jgi:hypothetical protein
MTSSTLYTLHRHRDVSSVSGTGAVATICEFSSGLVAMHWDSPTPSIAVYTDIRHIEALHGHSGASVLETQDPNRLLAGYQQVTFWLSKQMTPERLPVSVAPHPDWPDRLLLTFADNTAWRFWIGLLDGSTDAATHTEDDAGWWHSWTSHDGNVWLAYRDDTDTLAALLDEHPLETFDREDRG